MKIVKSRKSIKIELRAIQLYKTGLPIKDILKICKVSNTTLFRILKRNQVKKRGQPKQKVKRIVRHCPVCNKKIVLTPYLAKTRGKYCSLKCYWKSLKGKKVFDRTGMKPWNMGEMIEVRCENCGKQLQRHPYRLKHAKHQFCSTQCEILYQYKSGKFPRQINTDIERIMKEELIKRGFIEGKDFIHQFNLNNKFLCDFCFPSEKLIIECHGDWHHANPKIYQNKKLHPIQKKTITKDRNKEKYIRTIDNGTWKLLVFWGSEIKEDVSKCVDKIEEIMKEKGV
jgi:very-short-patch-repair endonuclease